MLAKIVTLPGDGIGPEVVASGVEVLQAVASKYGHQLAYEQRLVGGASIDAYGTALTEETLKACQESHWTGCRSAHQRFLTSEGWLPRPDARQLSYRAKGAGPGSEHRQGHAPQAHNRERPLSPEQSRRNGP